MIPLPLKYVNVSEFQNLQAFYKWMKFLPVVLNDFLKEENNVNFIMYIFVI